MSRDTRGRVRFIVDGHRFCITRSGNVTVYAVGKDKSERAVSPQKRTAMIRKYNERITAALACK